MWVLETKPRFLLSTELSLQYPGPHFSCQRRQNEDCIVPPFSIWCVCDHVHRCAHLQKSKDNLRCQLVFAFYLLETVPLVVCYCGCTQRACELLHPVQEHWDCRSACIVQLYMDSAKTTNTSRHVLYPPIYLLGSESSPQFSIYYL